MAADLTILEKNRLLGIELLKRFELARKLRPAALGSLLTRLSAPEDRRRIVAVDNGLKIYADPFTHLGQAILMDGTYEPETERIFRQHVRLGDVFLDVGANEGYFSALAGSLVGPKGLVIAVEPQSRLGDIINVNMMLNDVKHFSLYNNALGGVDGSNGVINLWPTFNSGASSIMQKYRFSTKVQSFTFISLDHILKDVKTDHVDFMKIDVEGFEGEVIRHALPQLAEKKIGKILLDYHQKILIEKGIDARVIHQDLTTCGYEVVDGNMNSLDSYVLYRSK